MADTDTNSDRETEPSKVELREFVYLDSLSVNSLLASLYMSIPQDVEQVFKESEEGQSREDVEAGITLPNLLSFGGSAEQSNTEREMNQTKATNRINDQYRFTVLHDALKNRNQIIDLTEENADLEALNPGDVIKIKGNCSTDPLYRLITSLSVFEDRSTGEYADKSNPFEWANESNKRESASEYRDQIYHGKVGLKIDTGTDRGPFGMAVTEEEMWIDLRNDFLGPQQYTVLGRVEAQLTSKDEWDLVDSFRILAEMMPSKDAYDAREELLEQVFENERLSEEDIDQIYRELRSGGDLPSGGEMSEDEMREEIREEFKSPLDPELLNEDDFVLRSGYVIDPIAIYW